MKELREIRKMDRESRMLTEYLSFMKEYEDIATPQTRPSFKGYANC